jgi:hypothetical protein
MSTGPPRLGADDLGELDALVRATLESGEQAQLPVLGYGEISLVLAWPPEQPTLACKRMPLFGSRERFERYRATLEEYLIALERSGVRVVATQMRAVEQPDGSVAGYVVQELLPTRDLATERLREADPSAGHPLVGALVSTVERVVGPRLGIDAQIANWTWDGSRLTYIDVSTPMLWSQEGDPLLDLDLLALAYPAILRPPLRRWVAPRVLDNYRALRSVALDLCGNLVKERLEGWISPFLERFNRDLAEPLSEAEVRRYYRSDARLWRALLAIRRLDRTWRRRIRRRPYPFLLPGRIDR